MTRLSRPWTLFAVGLAAVAALPVAARGLRPSPGERCALDGVAIGARHRVRVVDESGASRSFCSVACAEEWRRRAGAPPRAVFVIDEASGREIDGAVAWFVRSRVVTSPVPGDRIHAFAERAEAERHASTFGGTILEGGDRPFSGGDEGR